LLGSPKTGIEEVGDVSSDREVRTKPFRLHASVMCPSHAELSASIAFELGELDPDRFERDLTALAAALPAESGPEAQLRALGEVVGSGALVARSYGGAEELLAGEVIRRGHGHPLALAVVLAELGRRAGMSVGIVADERDHYVAHTRLAAPLLLDPRTGALVDATRVDGTLTWRCGHQVAAALLDRLQPRYERVGDIERALQVARLRCLLPFDDDSVALARRRLRMLSATLN
jgi:Transglutaminase-like superfamily